MQTTSQPGSTSWLLAACAAALAACGGDDDKAAAAEPAPVFAACAADKADVGGMVIDLYSLPGTVCTTQRRPLLWSKPDGQKIDVVTWKVPGTGTHKGSVLYLDGGPGATGSLMTSQLRYKLAGDLVADGWDLLTPTHRGTGRSTPLACTNLADPKGCFTELHARWKDGLAGFGPSEAARDVCATIKGLRAGGEKKVAIYGTSYGTFWGQSILAVCGADVDHAILDANMPALQKDTIESLAVAEEDLANRLLARCDADAACKAGFATLGGTAQSRFASVLSRSDAGTLCPAVAPALTRSVIGDAVFSKALGSDQGPLLALTFLFKADRCNAADAAQLTALMPRLGVGRPEAPLPEPIYNGALAKTARCLVGLAYGPPLSLAAARAKDASVSFSLGTLTGQRELCADFPIKDYAALTPVDRKVPILFLQGEFDAITTLWWANKGRQPHSNATFVVLPTGRHVVTGDGTQPVGACAAAIAQSFLNGSVDASCLSNGLGFDLSGATPEGRELLGQYFGVTNPFAP